MGVEQELRKAVNNIKQGKKEDARNIVEDVIKNDPNNADAWYLLSFIANTPEEVKRYLEKTIAINPSHEKAIQKLRKIQDQPAIGANAQISKKTKESKPILLILLALICILLLVITYFVGTLSTNRSIISTSPTESQTSLTDQYTWEYLSISLKCFPKPPSSFVCDEKIEGYTEKDLNELDTLGDIINIYGNDGWELVSIIKNFDDSFFDRNYILVFKRHQ